MAVEKNRSAASGDTHALSSQVEYTPYLRKCKEGTQNHIILFHLLNRGSITQKEAADHYGCYRLSARIKDLRDMGLDIETEMIPTKSKYATSAYAKYTLEVKE